MDDEELDEEVATTSTYGRFGSVLPWAAPGAGVSLSRPGRSFGAGRSSGSTSCVDAFTLASYEWARWRAVGDPAFNVGLEGCFFVGKQDGVPLPMRRGCVGSVSGMNLNIQLSGPGDGGALITRSVGWSAAFGSSLPVELEEALYQSSRDRA